MASEPLIRRVQLRNYKSIAQCDVELGRLMFLVGRNGSGKSNFLDALRFVSDALRSSLDHALRDRGGVNEVRRRSSGHPNHFGIYLEFGIPEGDQVRYRGFYCFEIGARQQGAFTVKREECKVVDHSRALDSEASYTVREGSVEHATFRSPPPAAADRLYLVHASGLPELRPVYDSLSGMGFYNLGPGKIRRPAVSRSRNASGARGVEPRQCPRRDRGASP
jgi:hypothetical protein